jgi:hypothetical protein
LSGLLRKEIAFYLPKSISRSTWISHLGLAICPKSFWNANDRAPSP